VVGIGSGVQYEICDDVTMLNIFLFFFIFFIQVYLLHKTVRASSPAGEATPKRHPHQLSEQTAYPSSTAKPQDLGSSPGAGAVHRSSQAVSKLHSWYVAWLDPVGCKPNAQESEKEKK